MRDTADPVGPRRGRRLPWLVAGVVALAGGFGVGWAVEQSATSERTIEDQTGRIEVTVPESWTTQVDPEQWVPPLEGQTEQPALATGSGPGWNTVDDPAPGVFVGLLQGEKLPARVPQHFACESNGQPIEDLQDGDLSKTVFFEGCPGTDVIVERVVQVTSNRLLWIQVASDDERTASRVLESVRTYGY